MNTESLIKNIHKFESDIEGLNSSLDSKANQNEVRESTTIKPINVSEMDTETKQLFTGGSVGVVDYETVGIENLNSIAFDKVFKSNKYTIYTIFDTCNLANGATNVGNIITIPQGSSGAGTLIRFKNTDSYTFKEDGVIDVYFLIDISDISGFNFGKYLKVTRNGVVTNATTKTNYSATRVGKTKYLVGASFTVIKDDSCPSPILEILSNTFMKLTTINVSSIVFYSSDVKLKEEINYLKNDYNALISDLYKNNYIDNILMQRCDNLSKYEISLSNGAILDGDRALFKIPVGQTGNQSFIRYSFDKNKYLVNGHKIRVFMKVETTPLGTIDINKITMQMNAFKPSGNEFGVGVNRQAIKVSDTVFLISLDYTLDGTETKLYSYIQVNNTTPCTVQQAISCYAINYTLISEEYLVNTQTKNIEFSLKNSKEDLSKVQMFNGTEPSKYYAVNVKNDNLYVEITQNFNTSLRAYGLKQEGSTEILLSTTNLNTGTTDKQMVYCSKYKVNCEGYPIVKFRNLCSDNGVSKLTASYYTQESNVPISCVGDYKNRVDMSKVVNTVKTELGVSIFGTREGKLIGAKLNNGVVEILESDTNYTNFITKKVLSTETQMILNMLINSDNSVIVACKSGAILRSEDLINYTEVLNISTHQFRFGAFSQWDSYNNIVLISEYKQPATYGNIDREGRNLYLSVDYGKTFKNIFNLIDHISVGETGGMHIHSVKFDPYESIIWVATGDGLGRQMVFYSLDMGETFYKSTEYNQSTLQFTQVIPLRNCVLFLTDCRLTGVVRYNRPSCGTLAGNKMHFDMLTVIQEEWGKISGTEVPIGSIPFIDYPNSKAYFGFTTVTNTHNENITDELKYGDIYTTDGYTVKKIFKDTSLVENGVLAIYGDNVSKKAIGKLGMSDKFVVMNTDIWGKC